MKVDEIVKSESKNDGRTICLYYNREIGFYTAYGFSAFLVSHFVDPVCSFAEELNMPVALVNREQILELRRSLFKAEHTEKTFYRFTLREAIGSEGYSKWMDSLKC